MAAMLQEDDSSAKHLRIVRRHQRRCKKKKAAAEFVATIEPDRKRLDDAKTFTETKIEAEENAVDDHEMADGELDDQVVVTGNRAEEYDTAAPGENMFRRFFPKGRKSDVTEANVHLEPDVVDGIIKAIEDLGPEHALYPLAKPLAEANAASRAGSKAVRTAEKVRGDAERDETAAKAKLRKGYSDNFNDMSKKFGKRGVERFFPRLAKKRKPKAKSDVTT